MADPIFHIKDSYFFEVPRFLHPSDRENAKDFPNVWVKLDKDFQEQQAHAIQEAYTGSSELPSIADWHDWQHAGNSHANFAAPYYEYVEHHVESLKDISQDQAWETVVAEHSSAKYVEKYKESASWDAQKLEDYNFHLSGKVLIPQPFGTLRNLHEQESGFAISKFMVIEVFLAVLLLFVFGRLSKKVRSGEPVRGKLSNLFEVFLLFIRDDVARPSIGSDADFHHGHDDHDDHGGHDDHHDHGPPTYRIADKITPILWTLFLFILGCNLAGMIPWVGSPTGVLAVTAALATGTFVTTVIAGSIMHKPIGFWLNQIPSLELSFAIALIIKPMLWVIEIAGLFIKHGVLAIRLLANLVAGHLVLLSLMGLGMAAANLGAGGFYSIAGVSVIGSAALSCLELFVAFLQAYVFTLLSALFIGAAMHHH